MKRRTVNLKRILPCIAALLVLANCRNLFQPPEPPPAQTGEGTFSLEIGGIRAGRTILPATGSNFQIYTLVFSAEGKTDIRVEWREHSQILLPAGTWDLTVTAFKDPNATLPCAEGRITGIEITAGGNTSRSVELTPLIEDGTTGTFSWDIDGILSTYTTLASMTITPLDEATGTAAQTLYFIKGGETETPLRKTIELNAGYYRVEFNVKGVIETGWEEYLHIYKNLESRYEYRFNSDSIFTRVFSVVNGDDSGPGSLRDAIANVPAGYGTILVEEVETITLESPLEIDKSLTILGNGVTLTRSAAWTASDTSQLLRINSSGSCTVNISRVHFKDGRANSGAAVLNSGGTVNLESCIFSGNQSIGNWDYGTGGAIYNAGDMNVKGCTFYNNSAAYRGGAIYKGYGTLTLTGNLFYGNTAGNGGPVVYESDGYVRSNGYNAADVALGTGNTQSGWSSAAGDKTVTNLPVSPLSFKLLNTSEAANVITTVPEGYPQTDFYGAAIADGAAAGAVQSKVSGSGYYLGPSTPKRLNFRV